MIYAIISTVIIMLYVQYIAMRLLKFISDENEDLDKRNHIRWEALVEIIKRRETK